MEHSGRRDVQRARTTGRRSWPIGLRGMVSGQYVVTGAMRRTERRGATDEASARVGGADGEASARVGGERSGHRRGSEGIAQRHHEASPVTAENRRSRRL